MDLNQSERKELFNKVFESVENYYVNTKDFKTAPNLNVEKIREYINSVILLEGIDKEVAIDHVKKGLEEYSVHTPHPKYFGLFNPRANFAGILADIITAVYNPQLAAWSHAPFAVEVEAKMIREFNLKFGYDTEKADGVFTVGGAEANLTAVLCSLNNKYAQFAKNGLFGVKKKPVIFCSAEAHHSIQKAAKIVGLGYDSVKSIPVTDNLKLDTTLLKQEIINCRNNNMDPLMVIATAGTTGIGSIDDLNKINTICKENFIWFHVDAAYGGAILLSEKHKVHLDGIEKSDSITFDAHKWMSVPMGASVFLTSHKEILGKTFRITTEYMPREANDLEVVEPFTHSIQWSRRFIGLKIYLSLLFYGWKGYEKVINHHMEMGELLRSKLIENGWTVKNNTALPVICFSDKNFIQDPNFTNDILNNILSKGKSWISAYPINGVSTFRACITNYTTTEIEIDELVDELNEERNKYKKALDS